MTTPTSAVIDPIALSQSHPLVFFDGVCGLCNSVVDFIIKRDRRGTFRFSPLQSQTARAALPPQLVESLSTVVLLKNGTLYTQTRAVVEILLSLGGVWALMGGAFWIVPQPLREMVYRRTAQSRYRIFGKRESCRLPSPSERERFLD